MKIGPTPALLHALSRVAEPPANGAGASPATAPKPPEAAKAAARAFFQAAGVPSSPPPTVQAPQPTASQSAPPPAGKTLPRGSFINLVV